MPKSTIIKSVTKLFELPRDPDDEIYINLAIQAEADFLVSRDNDLLDLMTDYDVESKEFRQRFRHLKIVQPVEFLQIVKETLETNLGIKP